MTPTPSTETKSKSTGPRTPEGKQKASHNALRHGLTGRVVVMPWEDMDAYNAFCEELMAELAPDGPIEKQYAQTFCDTQWRLNRARSFEDGLLFLDQTEQPELIDAGHPQANNAVMAARAFRDNSHAFTNLTLYEQRLNRTLKESLHQLKELQAERRAARQAAIDEAIAQRKLTEMKGESHDSAAAESRFVFSTPITAAEIEIEALRQTRRVDAEIAKRSGWNLEKYRETTMKQAA